MKLPPDVLQKIVLAMFATRGLGDGDIFWLSRFEEFWAQNTQLRRSDLLEGIAEVCTHGWIVLEEHEGKASLSLTQKGDVLAKTIVSRGLTDVQRFAKEYIHSGMRFRNSLPNARGLGRRWHESPETASIGR